MIKHLISSTAILASILACQVFAQQDEIGEAVSSATDAALTPIDPFAAEQAVNAQIQNFLSSELGQKLQAKPGKVWTAYITTSKSTNSADWGISRNLAYDRAWSKVQEDFIRWQYQETQDETISRLYEDASNGIPDYEPTEYTGNDAIDEFIEKSGAFISSKLDAALREAGVDPERYSRGSKKQRKELLVDSVHQRSLTTAFGKLSGLWPIKTFSGAVDGQEAIGVIGLYRPVYTELAGEIAGRRSIISNGASGRPLGERLTKDPTQLLGAFGVRVLRDEQGYPVLVAYGQSALSGNKASPTHMSSLRRSALGRARSAADRAMAQFINSTSNYTDENILGESIQSYIDVDRQGYLEAGDEVEFTAIREQLLTTKSKSTLNGVSSFTEWTHRLPDTEHILVGVVRVWSPVEAASARAVKTGRRTTSTSSTESKSTQQPSWNAGSPDLANPDDF